MPSIFDPEFEDREGAPPGFRCKRAWLGRDAGAERLGASLWEVPPGEAAYPYHFHYGDEELLIVLAGSGRLRTPAGWRDLGAGEVFSFHTCESGAHQLVATGDAPLRFLAISTSGAPDITVYPDSDKVAATERRTEGFRRIFRVGDAVEYFEGETPPHDA